MSEIPPCTSKIAEAAESQAARLKIQGAAGTGKTLALAYRVKHLVESGVDASDILVVVMSRNSQQRFADLLDEIGVEQEISVKPVHEIFVDTLSTPHAIESTGRVPRLLTHSEEKFLMEDMKTLGMKQNRLREMLKYFYRQWTEMGDRKEDFFVAVDEEQTVAFLKKLLTVEKGMLYAELSNILVHWLEDDACDAKRIPYLLVDDYQDLNLASQEACERLCTKSLTVAGNVNEAVETKEPYPYPKGFADFGTNDENAQTVLLERSLRCPQHIAAMENALALNEEMDSNDLAAYEADDPKGSTILLKYPSPDDEITKISEYVLSLVDEIDPENIAIVVPNRTWGKNIASYLHRHKVNSTSVLSDEPLGGDPRDLKKCQGLRAYTALSLIADHKNVIAWRQWCGYGDYLLNSLGWTNLITFAEDNKLDILDALAQVASKVTEPFPGASKVGNAYREGIKMLKTCSKKTGYGLLNNLKDLGMDYAGELQNALLPIIGDEDGSTLHMRMYLQLQDPMFEEGHKVHIGVPRSVMDGAYHVVIYTGLVNGFLPTPPVFRTDIEEEKKTRLRTEQRRLFYRVISRADRQLVLSYAAKSSLEMAEMMKMEVRRVRMEHGIRVALLTPCDFIGEMGEAAPGPVGEITFHHDEAYKTTHKERDRA